MPILKDNGDGTFTWNNDAPAPPWRPPDVSPVNEVRRDVVNTFQLTPQAAESLYRTPTAYETFVPDDESKGRLGYYQPQSEPERRFKHWAGLADYSTPIVLNNVYNVDPEYGQAQRPIVDPEFTLMHEWTHSQQYTNPAVRGGMERMVNYPDANQWYQRGLDQYGGVPAWQILGDVLTLSLPRALVESHATLAQAPWQFTERERQAYYPGVFRPGADYSQPVQPARAIARPVITPNPVHPYLSR